MTLASRRRCDAIVSHRDVLRRTGRGPSGWEMHYNKEQCKRNASDGSDFCWQHGQGNPLRASQLWPLTHALETDRD